VEEINLRTTVLRDEDGSVHVFPNGAIQGISNLTREYSYYVFSLSVSYNQDPDRAMQVLKEISEQLKSEETFQTEILAPLEVMGVDRLADAGMVIKARFKTLPGKQWLVGREMNRRIKKQFEEAKVEMPFPEQRVFLATELTPELRDEIKKLVQEAMKG
jgi:small-conductance mechanosensitive channel